MGGEKALAAIIATLCQAVEREYGPVVTRLFRVYKPSGEHFLLYILHNDFVKVFSTIHIKVFYFLDIYFFVPVDHLLT